jgi:arylsulfatase
MLGLGILERPWAISPRDEEAPPWESVGRKDWEDLRMAVYAAMVDRMDQGIGRLRAALSRLEIEDDTLLLFLSDNGGCAEFMAEDGWGADYPTELADGRLIRPGNRPDLEPGDGLTFMSYDLPWANVSNAPFRRFKHWLHEGGISTPLFAHWPAGIARPRLFHGACHVVDIPATIIEVAGATYPGEYGGHEIQAPDGESLLPVFEGKDWRRDAPIFWEHEGNCAVRSGPWKLVREHGRDWELYDMDADRTELTDLSRRNGPMTDKLARLHGAWAEEAGVVDWSRIVDEVVRTWGQGRDVHGGVPGRETT